jgi:long-chain acyl-CoA synthetase
LLEVIAGVTGERVEVGGEDLRLADLRLSEDLRLDSLGRVQLMDALESRLGVGLDQEEFDRAETLGELRRLVARCGDLEVERGGPVEGTAEAQSFEVSAVAAGVEGSEMVGEVRARAGVTAGGYVYPRWPWWRIFRWVRAAFVELAMRPLVWLLAAPRVIGTAGALSRDGGEPMLIIANHVTAYDVPLLLYGLPRAMRDRSAAAMSGEMLEGFRHGHNLQPRWLNPLGPPAWVLMTALFNVFPLPRRRDFQRSFSHAGEALDSGFDVMVFPEGTRSADGTLARFRPGIGLLVKQSFATVLPMAVVGLGDLKMRRRGWFRPGTVEVRVGRPVRFAASESEVAITARLQAEVEKLLEGE